MRARKCQNVREICEAKDISEGRAMNDLRLWFGPKRLGWGISPRTWEGWAVTGLIVAACIIVKRST
jgi:hypothetical protein